MSRSIGLVKSTNSQIVEVLRRDSEVLARIQDSFHIMARARGMEGGRPIEITCFYEELPVHGVGVVSSEISDLFPWLHGLTCVRLWRRTLPFSLATFPSESAEITSTWPSFPSPMTLGSRPSAGSCVGGSETWEHQRKPKWSCISQNLIPTSVIVAAPQYTVAVIASISHPAAPKSTLAATILRRGGRRISVRLHAHGHPLLVLNSYRRLGCICRCGMEQSSYFGR